MRIRILTSLFLSGTVGVLLASGQPPTEAKPVTVTKQAAVTEPELKTKTVTKTGSVKPLSLKETIALAMEKHVDVRVAMAEVELAQAKLQKTKDAVSQRVLEASLAVDTARQSLEVNELALAQVLRATDVMRAQSETMKAQFERGTVSKLEMLQQEGALERYGLSMAEARKQLLVAKAELTKAEATYQALGESLTGTTKSPGSLNRPADPTRSTDITQPLTKGPSTLKLDAVSGPFATNLRDVLRVGASMEFKNVPVATALEQLLNLRQKGTGITVRVPPVLRTDFLKDAIRISLPKDEHNFLAWTQLVLDELNQQVAIAPRQDNHPKRYEIYVRSYGLLVADGDNPPKDAMTLAEFAQLVQAEENAKKSK